MFEMIIRVSCLFQKAQLGPTHLSSLIGGLNGREIASNNTRAVFREEQHKGYPMKAH